jgi:hypothetical protein
LAADWQPSTSSLATTRPASPGHVAYGILAELIVTLAGLPFLIWSRRHDMRTALPLAFIWFCTFYVFLLTSLIDVGENNRFRLDLGPLPLAATAAVVVALVRAHNRRSAFSDARP